MREDAWLAARLGRPCFTVEDGDPPPPAGMGFFQAKVPCGDVARVHALEDAGFRVVDVNLTLRREAGALHGVPGIGVRAAHAGDRGAVLDVAEHHLAVSRFHRDPLVDPSAAAAIKRDWAASALDGERGDGVLVAEADGRVVGFLAVLAAAAARVIDLVAVHADARRSGAGRALVAHLAAGGAGPIEVGTQVANTGALAFYERLGFATTDTRFVLHRHAS